MKLDFSMAKAGDKNVGPLEIQRPNGEYDVWDIVKRGRLYLIGSFTNSGLLSDYYFVRESGESEMKAIEEINADLEVLAQDGESYMSRVKRIPKKGLKKNPPFYAHNLYEKKTHGLNLHQMRRLYAMVSRGNQKAITYARNVLGIPFSESPTQVKAVVYHHVRDLAERRVRRNPGEGFQKALEAKKRVHALVKQIWQSYRTSFGYKADKMDMDFERQIIDRDVRNMSMPELANAFDFIGKRSGYSGKDLVRMWNSRNQIAVNPARSHRERIAIDTVRHPMKGYFLGGPDLAESVRYLRSLGYSIAQLKKLNPEVEDILEGRKSILPNRRVKRNPFGGETLRSFKQKYKGFEIIVEIQPNTILATWTNGDILESDRFSGYELDEIFEEVKARIDALKRRRR